MARERYLVGVSPEELVKSESLPPPNTPKGKWENFWYHYKWVTIGVVFAVVAGILLLGQVINKVKPDYTVTFVLEQDLSTPAQQRLKSQLEKLGEDRNGDGQVVVNIQFLNVSVETAGRRAETDQRLAVAHVAARNVYMFALAPAYYQDVLVPIMHDDVYFFDKIGVTANGISEDGRYWNWKGSPLLKEKEMQAVGSLKAAPEELYFGVRAPWENMSEKERDEQQAHVALLKAFIQTNAE